MEEKSPASLSQPDALSLSSHSRPHRSLAQRIVIWIVVLLVFAGLFALVVTHKNTPQQQSARTGRRGGGAMAGPVTVVTATATKGDIGVYQEAIGTVTPVYTSSVTSQVTGLVWAVHYREGQIVHRGEPLVDIDPRPFAAQLAQAQGTLEKDTQILQQAKMDLERYRAAWARNAIAKQILDDQEKTVAQDEGTVASDKGVVQFDQVQLSYCHITAPFDGRVGLRLVDPGNVVQANSTTPLVVVTQQQPITVIFTVAEDALGQILGQVHHGNQLVVEAYDRAALTRIATGKLLTLDNQIDTTTGTVKLRAVFDNKDGALFPNQFVNTRLLVKTLKGQTLIPTAAIQHNGDASFVYLIRDQEKGKVVQMQTVQPGAVDAGMTAVEGIQPGDVVADSSFEKLQPNSQVIIAKGPQPASPSGSSAP